MDESRDGFRRFLEIQVEALQEQLYGLERDPEQVEHLKGMLRTCQRLRHGREPGEPESVRILRNAVEKVTLHIGRAGLPLTQDFLDFYVDSFDLLEEAVRRWPVGPAFDRARYADRVRALLDTTVASAGPPSVSGRAPAGVVDDAGWAEPPRGGIMAEEPVSLEVAADIVLTEPEVGSAAAEPALEDAPSGTGAAAHEVREDAHVEVLGESSIEAAERGAFVEADLRDLLAEPWRGTAGDGVAAPLAQPLPEERGGGLAASYRTYESLRQAGGGESHRAGAGPATREAVERLRDVLDAFSVSLLDLDRASDRVLREGEGLDASTRDALAARMQSEKEKVLSVFERTIQTFRGAGV
ncbi:MAG: hypothetical protein ABR599_07505 [Gemmatimonadota bacterium]